MHFVKRDPVDGFQTLFQVNEIVVKSFSNSVATMLPFLRPQTRLKTDHRVPHCMEFRNGFRVYPNPKRKNKDEIDSVDHIQQSDALL